MAEIASAFVTIAPSARGFGTSLNRQVGPQVNRSGATIGAGLGKSMLKGFVAIGVGLKIAGFLKDSVGEARESQKVAALTANVIKTTGGAANISADQVDRLANALSAKTGIDDEQIASSENLLLTFKNIKREGSGLENIFGRASRAAVDLSASGFGDLSGTSKQLGKALNDPVKGVAALTRVGVTFTDKQKEQIKTMVESGDTLGAQKKILKEVESQVKGSAEAQVTNSDKAKVAMDNLKEAVGKGLTPAIDAMAGLFADRVAPALTGFVTDLIAGKGKAGEFGDFIRNKVLPVLQDIGKFIMDKVVPAVRDALGDALDKAKSAFDTIRDAVRDNKPQLEQIANAFKKVGAFILTKLLPFMIRLQASALPVLAQAIRVIIKVAGFWVDAFNKVKSIIKTVIDKVGDIIGWFRRLSDTVKTKVGDIVETIKTMGGKVWTPIRQGAARVKEVVVKVFGAISTAIQGAIDKAQTLIDKLRDIAGMDKGTGHKAGQNLPKEAGRVAGRSVVDGMAEGIDTRADILDQAVEKVGAKVSKKLKEKISKIRDQLASVRSDFASLVEPVASNFTSGLFDFDTAGAFTANLTTVKGTLSTLMDNFKELIGNGLSPGFLYRLFQEGGPALIGSLADLDKAGQVEAGALFGQVTSLSEQLGTAVAGATDKGAALENQTVRLEKKLDKLINHVDNSADRTGAVINGTAGRGHRRGR